MKNIKEAEVLTGISRQNIRYYEKMGLLNPKAMQQRKTTAYLFSGVLAPEEDLC